MATVFGASFIIATSPHSGPLVSEKLPPYPGPSSLPVSNPIILHSSMNFDKLDLYYFPSARVIILQPEGI